jgi:tetratricopeptide (TPR) repeat protein
VTVDTAEAAAPVVDIARPWPGLDAFTEAQSPFFFGRNAEADELFRRVRRDVATLLFGQSGLGKTSLLQAGLFPRLRWADFLPILIRLDHSAGAPAPAAQVKAAIEREVTAADLSAVSPIGAEESLWGYFHRADRRLVDYAHKEIVPVLVFDQFEEIFTLGLAGDDRRAISQDFLGELAELVENRPPEALERSIETDPDLVEGFSFDRQDYRIVLALREDFLASLDSLRSRAPSLGRNRYRLRPMSGRQGLDAILNPAPGLVAPEVAQEIIRFIGRPSADNAFGIARDAAEGFEVDPSLLSLVCRELNERRIARGLDQIGADLLAGSRDDIIEGFYERCLADQPAALCAFVEDRLLSDSGFRENLTLDSARRILRDAGVPAGALDALVRRRLLRIEERLDVPRVEVIHDVLTPVIRKSRDTRQLNQARATAAEREAALQRERQRVRRAYWFAGALALMSLAMIGLIWWGWSSKIEAELQRVLADEQRAAVVAQSKRAEQNIDLAVTTADTMVTTVADRLRDLTGVPTATVRDILRSAEGAFEGIAAAAANSPHLRWRRAMMLVSFAYTYQRLGDSGEALRRAKAGRNIMHSLVKEDPENDQWTMDLARSSRALGEILCNASAIYCIGDPSGASDAYRDDLQIMSTLVKKDPKNLDWRSETARAHSGIGQVLEARGDLVAAVTEYRTALDIDQRLTEKEPDEERWRGDLAVGHQRLGNVLWTSGDLAGALTEYRADLKIVESLADANPGNKQWQRDLSIAHYSIGDVLFNQGNHTAGLAEYRTALEQIQQLAERDPGSTESQNDLSVIHQRVGDVLKDQGDLHAALAEYHTGLDTLKRLTEKDQDNKKWQRNLLILHDKVGQVLQEEGEFGDALVEYRAALEVCQHLAEKDSCNAQLEGDLLPVHTHLGDALRHQGDLAAALTEYRANLAISQSLAAKDLSNMRWQAQLSVAHERLGILLGDQDDHSGALAEYRAFFTIIQRLTEKDPGNTLWQRDLSIGHNHVGDALQDQGDLTAALSEYRAGLEAIRSLADKDPSNAQWQGDVSYSFRKIAWVQARIEETRRKIAAPAASRKGKK